MSNMSPVEIFEYKQRWMSSGRNNPITIHSDYRSRAKEWCRTQLNRPCWVYSEHTDVYEDTIYFEYPQDQNNFAIFLKKITSS